MRIFRSTRLALAVILLALPVAQARAQAESANRQKLLLTYFDPFGGSQINNTQPIAQILREHPEWIAPSLDIATCRLPVIYDEAAQVAMDCIRRERPDFVVSLGEASCRLRIESAANNLDDTPGFADNAGQIRAHHEIIPDAPARLGFSFPVESMMCAFSPATFHDVQASITPDNFVCNNVAYHLTYALPAQGIPYTFIHVPNSKCSRFQANPLRNAQRIAQALQGGLFSLRFGGHTRGLWLSPQTEDRMPSSMAETRSLLQRLKAVHAPRCELRYAGRLKRAYSRSNTALSSSPHFDR